MSRGFRPIDHTADLALEVWADDEPGLLVAAMEGLVALLSEGGDPAAVTGAPETRVFRVHGVDPEDRLVRWLAELLYLASAEGFLPLHAELRLRDDDGSDLDATVHGLGAAGGRLGTDIKAVTHHGVHLVRTPGRIAATVVLDV